MSTLDEIEDAIERLPSSQLEELSRWLEQRRLRTAMAAFAAEPDFLARAKAIWGEKPPGKALSEVLSESRG